MRKLTSAILAVLLLVQPGAAFAEEAEKAAERVYGSEYRVLEKVAGYASELYIDENITPDEIIKGGVSKMLEENPDELVPMIKTMVGTLDPYSEYMTKEEFEEFSNDMNKMFYGIGVIIQKSEEYVEIIGFTKDSPSEKAGINIGDKVAKVNGVDMRGKSMNEVRTAIMGEVGTEVTVSVLRGDEALDFAVTRSMVNQSTVECDKLDDKTAYIYISDMAANTAEEFADALKKVDEWGIKNVILDLRNNGGGYLDCAIKIAEMVVPEGLIVKTVYRQDIFNQDYKSSLKNTKYNFRVLVNEYTASAAEILASAMQESGAAKLIGTKTYGKAVIQRAYQLSNGSVLKLTVGHYITRNGNEINEVGIRPDEVVNNVKNPIDTKKYSQFDYKTKWSEGMSGESVKAAKERLYLLGFYGGVIDDKYDDLLKEAVSKFQENQELYAYGVLDITTQVRLENTFAKLEVLEDLQYQRALELFGVKEAK